MKVSIRRDRDPDAVRTFWRHCRRGSGSWSRSNLALLDGHVVGSGWRRLALVAAIEADVRADGAVPLEEIDDLDRHGPTPILVKPL